MLVGFLFACSACAVVGYAIGWICRGWKIEDARPEPRKTKVVCLGAMKLKDVPATIPTTELFMIRSRTGDDLRYALFSEVASAKVPDEVWMGWPPTAAVKVWWRTDSRLLIKGES